MATTTTSTTPASTTAKTSPNLLLPIPPHISYTATKLIGIDDQHQPTCTFGYKELVRREVKYMIMRPKIIPVVILVILATVSLVAKAPSVVAPSAQAAQADYFLKIEGIEGESQASSREGQIEILSWSWGETDPGVEQVIAGVGRANAGQPEFTDIFVQAYLSKASPKLMEAVATGKLIPSVVLTGLRSGADGSQHEYLEITLTNVQVTAYQTGGSQSEPLPIDSLSFNYEKIEYEYTPQNADGTAGSPVKAGYDLKKNEKV